MLWFQRVDFYTFSLKTAQAWRRAGGLKCTGSQFSDVIRRVKDDEYAGMIQTFSKTGMLPCNTLLSFKDPFQAVSENAELINHQAISWVSCNPQQGMFTAWGLCTHLPCAAGVRVDLMFYGTTTEQLIQHVVKCIDYLASGQSFTDPELEINFGIYYPEHVGQFECSPLAQALNWRRLRMAEYKQYVCMQRGTLMSPLPPQSHI